MGLKRNCTKVLPLQISAAGMAHLLLLWHRHFLNPLFMPLIPHEPSISAARRKAEEAGVSDRIQFEVASGTTFTGNNFDFVTAFDCLHDMGSPVAAAAHVLKSLKDDGTWMIVEPFAGDRVEDNLTPIGRLYYCASVLLCVPCALDQEGGEALGGQAGEARLREVITAGGFKHFRRATATPINIVYEAQP